MDAMALGAPHQLNRIMHLMFFSVLQQSENTKCDPPQQDKAWELREEEEDEGLLATVKRNWRTVRSRSVNWKARKATRRRHYKSNYRRWLRKAVKLSVR